MMPLLAPWPGMDTKAKLVEAFEASEWRSESMSFLELCRKSNTAGDIARWVKRLQKEAEGVHEDEEIQAEKLKAFANACPMKGEKLVACDMLSIFNDRWFGQWLALREPFRNLEDLLDDNIVQKAGPKVSVVCCYVLS